MKHSILRFLQFFSGRVFDYRIVLCLIAIYFVALLNWKFLDHFYTILGRLEDYDLLFAASLPFALFFAMMVVFTLISFRPFFKPIFIFLILTASIVSYAMIRYGIVFDRGMITNFAQTDSNEALSYINLTSVSRFIVSGLVPAGLLLILPIRYPSSFMRSIGQKMVIAGLALLCLGGITSLYFKDYASVGRNNKILGKEIVPVNYITASIQYAKHRYQANNIPFSTIGNDATRRPTIDKPTLMVLVVGETARAASVAANGYGRPTSPFTNKIPDLVAFQDVSSCGTATAVSIPCMFSPMTRDSYNEAVANNSENMLDVLSKAGVDVFWAENDGGCKGVCNRIPNKTISANEFPDLCPGELCFDESLVLATMHEIDTRNMQSRLIVVHLNGSHGPTYFERYPEKFRFFTPDCPRSDIENCTQKELINTYDNTIRYTDYVISRLIDILKQRTGHYNTGLLYVSDHGESLGESGLYLHGAPYFLAPSEQTQVPMMFWVSSGLAAAQKVDQACLAKQAQNRSFSHDNLFSTILGLMQVDTLIYNPSHDILDACRNIKNIHASR